ncbi:MAG TPA: hypothetical protein EYI97_02910, partial [Candidatus Poseidoniales archaeon]|nr:hypothetical protein [Candidatus Poseidoniales archaeon]
MPERPEQGALPGAEGYHVLEAEAVREPPRAGCRGPRPTLRHGITPAGTWWRRNHRRRDARREGRDAARQAAHGGEGIVSVIIIGEADGSAIKPASQQAAALAAQLGDSVGLVFGSNSAASQLAAPRVVSASALESYDALQFAAVAAQVARDAGATAVVMAATAMGKDLG